MSNTLTFAGFTCKPVLSTYRNGGTALQLVDAADGEPVATASVWVEGVSPTLPPSTFVLKTYSENEGIQQALGDLITPTGQFAPVGFTRCPIVTLTKTHF